MNEQLVATFAEKQTHYTGANNKRKWVIICVSQLHSLLSAHEYKPAQLAKTLEVSYATVKRWLTLAGLWDLAVIRKLNNKGGRKRTVTVDKFGYLYASAEHDILTDTGEIKRRFEHSVVAEAKVNRPLRDREVVHHIDLNKENNDPENLFVCEDNKQHRRLHGQLERLAGKLVQKGVVGFNEETKEYYIKEVP